MNIFLLLFFAVISADGAKEGDFCDLNSAVGVCTKSSNCSLADEHISTGTVLKSTVCVSKGKEDLVCCRKDQSVTLKPETTSKGSSVQNTIEDIWDYYDYKDLNTTCDEIPSNMTSKPTGQKAWDKCIEYQDKYVYPCELGITEVSYRANRCVNHEQSILIPVASSKEFPHKVLLGPEGVNLTINWMCAGSLISDNYVLTAAHCTRELLGRNLKKALIGEDLPRNYYSIKRIIRHPDFKPPLRYNDIALVELGRGIPLDARNVVPACLHISADEVDESQAIAYSYFKS